MGVDDELERGNRGGLGLFDRGGELIQAGEGGGNGGKGEKLINSLCQTFPCMINF